ncbi:alcohol dehydrogenase [Klebsiella pneumoniae]|uniref:Alcohol dehydrogenase n=1 Tax=Klebsiella pneumoniae TaxID=573 RepID=A0A378A500_KLEPN|nr:alcohol dehydrogenase [Klebsiella pneumoniae]
MSYRMFDYLVPNVNFFGPNAISVVGERCQLLGGKKALLVTDKGLRAIKDGAVDKTLHYLREAGIEVAIFDGVEPNPKDTNVRDGLAVFRREQCDIIVTVGGGSPHDCGKGIGIAATHEGRSVPVCRNRDPDQPAAAYRRGQYHRRHRQRGHPPLRPDQHRNQSEVCDRQLAQPAVGLYQRFHC